MAGTTYVERVELTVINCGCCGGTYAINERYRQHKLDKGDGWHCPYCERAWGYFGNSEIKRLKDELERRSNSLVRAGAQLDQTRAELKDTENRRRAEKAAKTRIKNRVSNGVCPCCNRSFANLHRHMATQHPDYTRDKGNTDA